MTEDQKSAIKNIVYEVLPCATNKVCKEVNDVKDQFKKWDNRLWVVVGGILLELVGIIAVLLK